MAYQEDLILSIYGRGEPGLAMADPLPKDDPNRPVKAPGKDGTPSSPYLPGKSPMPSKGLAHHTGGKHFTEPSMDELIQGIIEGEIPRGTLGDEETEQQLIQEYLERQAQSMFINQELANLRPQDFIPFSPATRDSEGFAIPYLRTPDIRDMEMDHFKRFIKNSGESTWDLTQRKSPMMIAKGKKKKKKELTIYDEAARRDAFRDMANEPYDPDTGRMGGGFDIMDDLLDGV